LLCCHGSHGHQPAFPTRRSSDLDRLHPEFLPWRSPVLWCPLSPPAGRSHTRYRPSRRLGLSAGTASVLVPPDTDRCVFFWSARRSEEHTSELQSREKLVCRLPLE